MSGAIGGAGQKTVWTSRDWILPWVQVALVVGVATGSNALIPAAVCVVILALVPFRRGPAVHRRWIGWGVLLSCSVWWVAASLGGKPGGGFAELVRIGGWCLILLASWQIPSLGRGGSTVLVAWCVIGAQLVFSAGAGRIGIVCVGLQVVLAVEAVRRVRFHAPDPAAGAWRWLVVLPLAIGLAGIFHVRSSWSWWHPGSKWANSVQRAKGFSLVSRLGTFGRGYVSESDDDIAVRVWSDSPPALLKGMVHDIYSDGNWIADRHAGVRGAERMSLDFSQFCRDVSDTSRPRAWALATDDRVPVLFAPPGTGCVGVVADSLSVRMSGVFRAPAEGLARGWTWYGAAMPDTSTSVSDLRVPRDLEGLLDSFLVAIGRDSVDATGAVGQARIVNLVTEAIESRFRYDLDVPVEPGVDPLQTYFRIGRGYCEYHATAAVLLLRRAGIRARYATGYSGPEPSGGRGWIYRQGGAHAWAEWKPIDGNWQTLDPAPVGATPAPSRSRIRRLTESVSGWIVLAWHDMRDGNWRERLEAWQALAEDAAWGSWGSIGGVLLAFVALVAWLRRRVAKGRDADQVWTLRLDKAESLLRRQGYARSASETVGSFLARLPREADSASREELIRYQSNRWRRGLG
ncbi:MAG: transglutaminase-like domain-containing protein [Fibrobacterota bacterium]